MLAVKKLVILLFLLSSLFWLEAGPKIGDPHTNNTYNYRVLIPKKWTAIPVPPEEKIVIDKFQGDADSDGISPKLEIMVLDVTKVVVTENVGITFGEGGKEGPAVGSEEWMNEQMSRWEEESRPKSYDEYIRTRLREWKLLNRYEVPWKKGKYKRAQVYEIGFEGHNSPFLDLSCAYRLGNVEYVLSYTINRKDLDKDRDEYLKSFQSFLLTKEATGIKQQIVDVTKLPPHQRRQAVKKNLPKGWYAQDTARYVILTNITKKNLLKEVAQHLELIRDEYERLFPPKTKIDALSVVRLCASRSEYHGYGGPPGSAGYFSPMSKELVIYDDSEQNKKNTFAVLYHECFHQYTFYFFGKLSAHRWYDEGLGDYFAGAELKGNRFEIKKFDWRTETIRNAVIQGKHHALEKFVRMSQPEYYKDADVCYAQGWAFIYFLKNTRNSAWSAIINKYIEALAETKKPEDAVNKAFEGIDYATLDKAFENFVRDGFKIK
jgi:hypothetical protein